jgi:predicted permease
MQILNILIPVFAVIGLGALLRRIGFLTDSFQRGLNRLAYYVGLPCLLFLKTAEAEHLGGAGLQCLLIILGATGLLIGLSFALARRLKLRGPACGAFVQTAYRSNNAYIGLPLVSLAFLGLYDAKVAETALSVAALALGPTIIFYNLTGIPILILTGNPTEGRLRTHLKTALIQTLKNPLVIGILAGAAWKGLTLLTGITLPEFVHRTVSIPGQTALPCALLCIGYAMGAPDLRRAVLGPALMAALLKNLAAPLLGMPLILLTGAGPVAGGVALLVLACPTALGSFVLAEELESDTDLTAAAIFLSTLLALPTLSLLILLLRAGS